MKNILFLLMIGLMWGCGQQDYVVRSSSVETADYNNYETYAFASSVNNPNNPYVLSDNNLQTKIKDAISYELSDMGYEKSSNDPDLLVNFRVLERDTELMLNQEDDYWGPSGTTIATGTRSMEVEAGTLIVDVADVETGQVVWTGLASGILDGNQFDRRESSVDMAVQEIFDQFTIDRNTALGFN